MPVGFGSIPGAILNNLKDHKDLGMFVEAFPENAGDFYEAGAITNAINPFNVGKSTTTFAMGTHKLCNLVHENRDLCIVAGERNERSACARAGRQYSVYRPHGDGGIPEAVCFGADRGKYYSSTGGQSDISRGACLAKHENGFAYLHSSVRDETVSTIVPTMDPGTAVSTYKDNTDLVVTEHGVAVAEGKTIRERIHVLIGAAYPKLRDELEHEAKEVGYW